MKRFFLIFAVLPLLLCAPAGAQNRSRNAASRTPKVRFMPQWTPQAQFAGYYAALEKGFYAEEGIDVEIDHINATSRKSSLGHLRSGDVDIAMGQMLQAIVANARWCGGQFLTAPEAVVDDGLMDVCLIHSMSLASFLIIIPKYSMGEHLKND